MKFLILFSILLSSPLLWAKSWYYSCGKTLNIETKILIDEAQGSWMPYKAQYWYPGKDSTTGTLKTVGVDLIGSLDQATVLTGKPEKTFAFMNPQAQNFQLYVQPATVVGTKVKALQMTILSTNPPKAAQSKLNCVLVDYKD